MRVATQAILPSSVRREIRAGVWLDSRLAVWLADERVLVVADLHWGFAAAHRARGNLLPWWGDDRIENALRELIRDYAPAEMIWLGDCVHAAEGGSRALAFIAAASVPITLLAGNHDRRWRHAQDKTARRGRFFLHHGDAPAIIPPGAIEIIGHHHPALSWGDRAGGHVKLPALVASEQRLVLPAFSPWAAGTTWNSGESAETLWAISPTRIFAVERGTRIPEAPRS